MYSLELRITLSDILWKYLILINILTQFQTCIPNYLSFHTVKFKYGSMLCIYWDKIFV